MFRTRRWYPMIEEKAVVVSIEGEHALVETRRESSCGSCSAKAGCGTALLASVFGNRRSSIRVLNRAQAKVGDGVVVGLSERALTQGSLLAYILPLAAMMLAAGLGRWIGTQSSLLSPEPVSIAGGLVGLVLGLLGMKRVTRRLAARDEFQAVVLRVIPAVSVSAISLQAHSQES